MRNMLSTLFILILLLNSAYAKEFQFSAKDAEKLTREIERIKKQKDGKAAEKLAKEHIKKMEELNDYLKKKYGEADTSTIGEEGELVDFFKNE